MKLISTRSKSPLSIAIRWLFRENCSHFAIVFDDCFLVQSNLLGVGMDWWAAVEKSHVIVDTIDVPLAADTEDKLWKSILDGTAHLPYDFGGFAYLGYRGLLLHFFKKPMPLRNKWAKSNQYMCMEMARLLSDYVKLPDDRDLAIVTPAKLFQFWKDHGVNK